MKKVSRIKDDPSSMILKAATKLFAKNGFGGVSTRDICIAVGCNMAAISYYFQGKENLYQACLASVDRLKWQSLTSDLESDCFSKDDFERKLVSFCLKFSGFVSNHPHDIRLLINDLNSNSRASPGENGLGRIIKDFESFFQTGQVKNLINSQVDSKLISRMIISAVLSQFVFTAIRPYEKIRHEELVSHIVKSCTANLYV